MKKLLCLLLSLCMLPVAAACGGTETPEPNAGLYEAVSAEALGISIDVAAVFEDGFSIELKAGGKAVFRYEGKDYNMKWSLSGDRFRAEGGGAELEGTLSGGVMELENILDSGVDVRLVCKALAGSAEAPGPAEPEPEPAEGPAEEPKEEPVEAPAEEPPASDEGAALVGRWRHESGYTYSFLADGTGTYSLEDQVMNFHYELSGAEISFLYEGNTLPWVTAWRIEDNRLIIVDALDRDVAYTRVSAEPVLDALKTLPVLNAQQSTDMSNWMGRRLLLIDGGTLYGRYFLKGENSARTVALELRNDGSSVSAGSWRVLDEDCWPIYVAKRGDTLFYVRISHDDEAVGIARVNTDGSDLRVLAEGDCDYLSLVGERLYYTDGSDRLFSMDLDGGDRQLIVNREVYYPYPIDGNWILFQDDADRESLHLLHIGRGVDIKLNDEPSYHPILCGSLLFFGTRDAEVSGAFHLNCIDLSRWDEVYDESLGCHVPSFPSERSEQLFGGEFFSDGTCLYPCNNYNAMPLSAWYVLTDDAYSLQTEVKRFLSEDYEVEDVLNERGLVDRVMFFDRHTNYGYAIPWLS